MGSGSSDSAATRSRDTSDRMDEREDKDDLAEEHQQRVEAYAQQADDDANGETAEQSDTSPSQDDAAGGDGSSDADDRLDTTIGGGGGIGLDGASAEGMPEDEAGGVDADDDSDSFPGFDEYMAGEAELPDDPGDIVDDDDPLGDIELGEDSDEIEELLSDDQPRTYDDEATYRAIAVDGAEDIDGAEDFAQEVLHDETVATRYRPGGAPPSGVDGADAASPPAEPGSHRFGGWSSYDPGDANDFRLLPNTDAEGGHTANYMEVADVDGAGMGTSRAYITHYNEDFRPDIDRDSPKRYYAHRQMIGYAFTDSVGGHVPPHTFNRGEDWVAVGGVAGDPVHSCSEAAATQVTEEELTDQLAIQVLGGNMDLHTSNVFVGTDGRIHCIDMDQAGHGYDTYSKFESTAEVVKPLVEDLNKKRPPGEQLDVDGDDIAGRAREIAVSLHVSGEKERVYETLESYDEVCSDYYDESLDNDPYGERVKQNIEMLINDAKYRG